MFSPRRKMAALGRLFVAIVRHVGKSGEMSISLLLYIKVDTENLGHEVIVCTDDLFEPGIVRKLEQRRRKKSLVPESFFRTLNEGHATWYASEGFLDFLDLAFSTLLGSSKT